MKPFFATLTITLCAALLAGGLLWADVQTRTVAFEECTPPYARRENRGISLPLPVGGEVLRRVYQGEKVLIHYLFEKMQNIT